MTDLKEALFLACELEANRYRAALSNGVEYAHDALVAYEALHSVIE